MVPRDKILVIDDSKLSRQAFQVILGDAYDVETAEDGKQGMVRLAQKGVAAILLDLVMPEMDGYAFLEHQQNDPRFSGIPVIVMGETSGDGSELKALQLGARDFVRKTESPEIIRMRVRIALEHSRSVSYRRLRYLAEYDALTGLYNRSALFAAVRRMLAENPETQFAFIRFDIDNFKLINTFFGLDAGNKLLCYMAVKVAEYARRCEHYVYGRIERDVFGICVSYTPHILEEMENVRAKLAQNTWNYSLVPSFGIYMIEDKTLSPATMYDRASMAAETRKGHYLNCYALYTQAMDDRLRVQQDIQNEMAAALEAGQFTVYLQPKFSLRSNTYAGAEALVRWIHPEKGIVSPADFIPLFENNGFISRLDYYVWERVCKLLAEWIGRGEIPLPISVNVSRVDLCDGYVADKIISLTKRYHVPPRLLQLEVTESAYTGNLEMVQALTAKLRLNGFAVVMDDFGSGYSSLNMLKDIHLDALKLDMRFFSGGEVKRGQDITAAMIRMAKWLHLPVVAEGVETAEQVEFLRRAGCEYVQGYYYGRPAPAEQYATILSGNGAAEAAAQRPAEEPLDFDALLDDMFAQVHGCIALCEFDGSRLLLLRSGAYMHTILGRLGILPEKERDFWSELPISAQEVLLSNALKAEFGREKAQFEYDATDSEGHPLWLEVNMRYLQHKADKCILLLNISDITAEKEALRGMGLNAQ